MNMCAELQKESIHFQQLVHLIVLHEVASVELEWKGLRMLLVSVVLFLFAKKSVKKTRGEVWSLYIRTEEAYKTR